MRIPTSSSGETDQAERAGSPSRLVPDRGFPHTRNSDDLVGEDELTHGLESGTLVTDTRLRDALRTLQVDASSSPPNSRFALPESGASRLALHSPDIVDDAAFAVECAEVGEVDLTILERHIEELERRIAWLEERFWPRALRRLPRDGSPPGPSGPPASIDWMTGTELQVRRGAQHEKRIADGDREERITVIRPATRWPHLDVSELWHYRELLGRFAWRDVTVRYKQTFLGVAWAILVPLFTAAIYVIVFGRFAKFPSGNMPYPQLVLSGLIPMQYFTSSLTGSSTSLVANMSLDTKVYFPRVLLPLAAVLVPLVDLLRHSPFSSRSWRTTTRGREVWRS